MKVSIYQWYYKSFRQSNVEGQIDIIWGHISLIQEVKGLYPMGCKPSHGIEDAATEVPQQGLRNVVVFLWFCTSLTICRIENI